MQIHGFACEAVAALGLGATPAASALECGFRVPEGLQLGHGCQGSRSDRRRGGCRARRRCRPQGPRGAVGGRARGGGVARRQGCRLSHACSGGMGSADSVPALARLFARQGPFAHGALRARAHSGPRGGHRLARCAAESRRRVEGGRGGLARCSPRRGCSAVTDRPPRRRRRGDGGRGGDSPRDDRDARSGERVDRGREKSARRRAPRR